MWRRRDATKLQDWLMGHQEGFIHEGKKVKVAHPLLDQVGVTADAGNQEGYLPMDPIPPHHCFIPLAWCKCIL
jgi:hypothetical protein